MSVEGKRHVFHCSIRWGDMDAFGHVNNVTYLTYLEEARTAFLFSSPEARAAMNAEGPLSEGIVVARQEIDYLAPLFWREEPLEIHTWVEHIGRASFTLAYELFSGATAGGSASLAARARTVMVPYSRATASSRPVSDSERALLSRYLVPPTS